MDNHNISMDNRQKLTITAVKDVDNFNEEVVNVVLAQGTLVVKGEKLHIQKLDLVEGKTIIDGNINSLSYTQKRDKGEGGFFKRLLK